MKKPILKKTLGERGLAFHIEGQGQSDFVTIPSELLDDEVGENSTDKERANWVENNIEQIIKAYKAKSKGGIARAPFNRITVKREN